MQEPVEHHQQRIGSLEARYSHLDNRVSSIAEDMSAVKSSVDALVGAMDKVTTRINQPNQTNWVGMAALAISIMLAGSQYVDLRLNPVKAETITNYNEIHDLRETVVARGEVVGDFSARLNNLEASFSHLDSQFHSLENNVNALGRTAAAITGAMPPAIMPPYAVPQQKEHEH